MLDKGSGDCGRLGVSGNLALDRLILGPFAANAADHLAVHQVYDWNHTHGWKDTTQLTNRRAALTIGFCPPPQSAAVFFDEYSAAARPRHLCGYRRRGTSPAGRA